MTLNILRQYTAQHDATDSSLSDAVKFTKAYNETIQDEMNLTETQIAVKMVGKVDAKKRLEAESENLLTLNVLECLGAMLGSLTF